MTILRWLLCLACVAAPASAQGLTRVLYLHGEQPFDEHLVKAARELGFDAVNVTGAAATETPGSLGLAYYFDQPIGKGLLEIRDEIWRTHRDGWDSKRSKDSLERPESLARGANRRRALELLQKRLLRARDVPPFAIALADEASVTSGVCPLDFDFGADSLAGFREFLKAEYGSVDALNSSWGATFVSLERAEPWTTERIRRRELGRDGGWPAELRPWSDHRRYSDREFADCVRDLAETARLIFPDVPVGLTGMQPPAAFGGQDYSLLLPAMSFYEAYDIGGARDLAMSLAAPGARRLETLGPAPKGAPAIWPTLQLADYLAHGADTVVVWSSGDVLRGKGEAIRRSDFGNRVRAAFRTLEPVAKVFGGAAVRRDRVWIVESQPSVRAWWMVDSAGDGKTWTRRWTSYESAHSTSMAARDSWLRVFEDLGIQARLVPARDLTLRLRDRAPQLLVLPATLALSDAEARAIRTYCSAGGTVLADHSVGLYDENLVLRESPVLDELFGVGGRTNERADLLVDQGRAVQGGRLASGAAAAERSVSGSLSEPQGVFEVQLERQVGRGRAIYLNLAMCEYAAVRLAPEKVDAARDYRRRVRHVMRRAGVKASVQVRGENLPTAIERLRLRGRNDEDLLAIRMNTMGSVELTKVLLTRGRAKVRVSLPFPRRVRDVVTGTVYEGKKELDLTLDPATGIFLRFERGNR